MTNGSASRARSQPGPARRLRLAARPAGRAPTTTPTRQFVATSGDQFSMAPPDQIRMSFDKRAQLAADVVFAKLRNDPPAGAGSSRRVRPGRGHDPGKDGHRSRRTWFLRNRATTLPPGQAPLAGFDPGGARPGEGRAQVAADVVFAKSRNNPPAGAGSSRRVRHGRGHDPGKDGHSSRRTWFLRNRATTLPPGQAPLAGLDTGGGTTRGRTGTGRGGRGFCEIAQRPSRRGRLLSPGSAGGGTTLGKDRHRSRRTWFLRNAQRPSGRVLRRGCPGSGAPRVCAMQQSGTGLVAATSGLGLWGRAPSPSSLRASTLSRKARER